MLGDCSFCGRFGHKSEVCRRSDQAEALKKTNIKKDKERKIKKDKVKKKTKAKKVRDFLEIFDVNSPESSEAEVVSSDEESESEDQSPGPAVKKVHETPESRREARAHAFAENISDEKVIEALNLTKLASKSKVKKVMSKKGRSYTDAAVSKYRNFRKSNTETLLLDTGAGVNIVGEDIIKDIGVKVYKLKHERQVTEASGNKLDIIGVCEFYVKLECLKKAKLIKCLVLRGSHVDREILISCDMLVRWDLLHDTFGQETISDYVKRTVVTKISKSVKNVKNVNASDLYCKNTEPTNKLLDNTPKECLKLREKILTENKHNFKDKLGPLDRINHPPVKLKIDESRGIKPVKNTRAYDIPLHLRQAAEDEFNEMLAAGIIEPAEPEATGWASMAFPRKKPNSSPIKVCWVTDFRDLNRALDRPVWGGESSSQLLRHLHLGKIFCRVSEMT